MLRMPNQICRKRFGINVGARHGQRCRRLCLRVSMVVLSLLCAFLFCMFSSEALINVPAPSCPGGQVWVNCVPCAWDCSDRHLLASCTALCPNPGCACPSETFWDGKRCVPSDHCPPSSITCPPGIARRPCVVAPCSTKVCQRYPLAACVDNYCCDCEANFYWEGRKLSKEECDCPGNQIFEECGSACPATCSSRDDSIFCPTVCRRGCGCPLGTVLSEVSQLCIPAHLCSKQCPNGQVYHRCKPCGRDCKYAGKSVRCPAICKPGCACPDGYVWSELIGECVPINECPTKCKGKQVFVKCKSPKSTCRDLTQPPPFCDVPCEPGCDCPPGFVYSEIVGDCVPNNWCPSGCPNNQIYYKCKPCTQTCKTMHRPVPCLTICLPGCGCPKNTVLNEATGECVTADQCPGPPTCPGNQVWVPCIPCAWKCSDKDQLPLCFPRCPNPGCACAGGTFWDGEECVPPARCPSQPDPTCPGNQVWFPCKPCAWKCSNRDLAKVCRPGCPNPGCACPFGTFWDGEECVPPDSCPPDPDCPGNQVFYPRCKPCLSTCKDVGKLRACPAICASGCSCPRGKYWSAKLKRCVSSDDCPKDCPSNKVYHECVPCQQTCKGPRNLCRLPCKPGCGCAEGYKWSAVLKKCVLSKNCPKDCPGNQVFYPRCKPCLSTCKDVGKPKVCLAVCLSGCSCPRGKYWSEKLKRCVSSDDCPEDCSSNKVYHKCLPCQQTCKGPTRLCTSVCKPGCGCAKGYKWSAVLKKCVLPNTCPKDCPGNQVFYPRCKPCLSTCKDVGKPKVCLAVCLSGCSCPRGKYWSEKLKRCVSSDDCPEDCSSNKVYHKCLPCQQTCKGPTRLCTSVCKPGCGCAKGYKWSAVLKKCVLPNTCPKDCPGNQVFYPRCKPCLSTCKDVGKPKVCLAVCLAGCSCPRGKYWSVKLKRCVSSYDCPKDCPGNQLYYSRCKPCLRTCDQVGDSCTRNCLPAGCSCPAGKYWNIATTTCVDADDCPTKKCLKNQIYKKCVWCVPKCPRFAPSCTRLAKCSAKCTCSSGLYMNAGGYCVARNRCPHIFG